MNQTDTMKDLNERITKAVAHYWQTKADQRRKQESGGKADQGLRSAAMGGLDGAFRTPAGDLSLDRFAKTLAAHSAASA
jgi:hypothetical protein